MKFIKNIALLGILVVLGACSVSPEEQAFFNRVKGKTVYGVPTNQLLGSFSSDGKIFMERIEPPYLDFPFEELINNDTASYFTTLQGIKAGYKFITTDGETGLITQTIDGVNSFRASIRFE